MVDEIDHGKYHNTLITSFFDKTNMLERTQPAFWIWKSGHAATH